eukprot:364258-Chlamydomonas_euryale.AAC.13
MVRRRRQRTQPWQHLCCERRLRPASGKRASEARKPRGAARHDASVGACCACRNKASRRSHRPEAARVRR